MVFGEEILVSLLKKKKLLSVDICEIFTITKWKRFFITKKTSLGTQKVPKKGGKAGESLAEEL